MYSGSLKRIPFQPDSSAFRYAEAREEYIKGLQEPAPIPPPPKKHPESLARLLEMISPEDSALIALVVFLLCDNSENDVVLLGILLYVLLSK